MVRKVVIGGIFTVGAIIFGFIMLLRSCLAKYDERSAISAPVIVEDKGKTVVFSLIKFGKTTSYRQNGGFVSKSVNTSYYIQSNDGISGSKLQSKKIKTQRQIKSYPVEVLGVSNKKVWIYAGELMAFDPFTLETVADRTMIEERNPLLKGKLPAERRYYELDKKAGSIAITATDGGLYQLNTATLATLVMPDEKEQDPIKAKEKDLEKKQAEIRRLNDSNYSRYRNANQLYAQKKISYTAYRDSSQRFEDERATISKMEDSLRQLASKINEEEYAIRDQEQLLNTLEGNRSFSQSKVNSDSFNHKWFGLYTIDEVEKLREQFDYDKNNKDIARNKLYTTSLTQKDPANPFSKWIIGADRQKIADAIYLNGGFLLDINTGKPIHLSGPDAFLIVAKEQVGNDAKIWLSRVSIDGKQLWSVNTGLKDFAYWTILNDRFYLLGTDNKELSSGEINVLHIIDLKSGGKVTHDYFKDKNR